jgi:hypothetical protein
MNGKIDSNLLGNFGIDGASGGSNIKSPIQRGEYSVLSTDAIINITISAVDLTKAIPRIFISPAGGTSAANTYRCILTSPTNLQITRPLASGTGTVAWEVVEFNNVKSLQNGTLTLTSTLQNLPISAVNMNKSSIYISSTNSGADSELFASVDALLTTSTNIKIVSYTSTYTYIVNWYVIEFN